MEPENDGLEDDFPFPGAVCPGSMLIFRAVSNKKMGRNFQLQLDPGAVLRGSRYLVTGYM